ncbi:MAG: DUF4190 domain-containing protein [Verrucomicrobiales bacterium]|nr:DUF4190 domain-containing protein [Verrucomicrobiales bacterium]
MSSEPPLIVSPNQPTAKVTPPGAVWSLVFGILSLFCLWILGSIPAIILGAISIKKAKANPETVGGEGLALAGIITGSIGVFTGLVAVGIMASIAMPAYNVAKDRADETMAMQSVREVALATINYSTSQPDGKFPETLNELIPEFIADESKLSIPKKDGTTSPILYRKVDFRGGAEEPMLLVKLRGSNNYLIGYSDGSVQKSTTPLDPALLEAFEP